MLTSTIIAAAFLTSILSAIFGMAGGLMLMGVYGSLLSVSAAMVLHGTTQFVANGSRFFFLREYALWRNLRAYFLGTLGSLGIFAFVRLVPSQPVVFIALGLLPFIRFVPAPEKFMRFERTQAALLCGFSVGIAQLLAGVAGPLLDIFFVQTHLTKKQIIANKAATQTFAHLCKTGYFLGVADWSELHQQVSWPLVFGAVVAALAGTAVGKSLMERLSEARFKSISNGLVLAIGMVYLAKGIWLLKDDL